ncbi:Rpn family recombination-promoting nuclease/putative transposase [Lachnospiraceae bacterium 66-29]
MDYKKAWEELQIKDDFLFAKVMRDKKICAALIERLLGTKIKDIIYLEEEKKIDIKWDAKSVRLDVYVEDGNRVFNLEMQTTNQKNLPYRSRYYQGMIDLNTIEKGESYRKLKESYVIFICTFDPFEQGKAKYTFENLCVEDKELRLKDGTRKIFLNAKGYQNAEEEDVREFLKYVNGEESDNIFVKKIESKVEQIKSNKEWRQEYMTMLMREAEIREQSREEGRLEGIQEGRLEGRLEGVEEGIKGMVLVLKELGVPTQTILSQIQEKFHLSQELARKYL